LSEQNNTSLDLGWFVDGFPHIWLPYTQMKTEPLAVPVERTEGTRIYLANGQELIDGMASWWTACHGYNHPYIRRAIEKQVKVMPHIMFGGLVHEPALTLAAKLAKLLPSSLNRVFFSESGSVSVEIAMKMAIQYWINKGSAGKTRIISFRGGYHGDTLGAMSICDPEEGMHSLFQGALLPQHVVPLPRDENEFEIFESFLDDHVHESAAVIIEPLVQGAGGMLVHSADCLHRISQICQSYDLLLIFDEIFTGFGRTGQMFALDEVGVVPDILTLSKALTGGTMALSATVASDNVFESFLSLDEGKALMHGPTYMANPLACAAANASIELFEKEPRIQQVAQIERWLQEFLPAASCLHRVTDVRVKGAIGVLQLVGEIPLNWLRRRFVDKGVWIRPFGNIIYLTPALTITEAEIHYLVDSMMEVIEELAES
jgi:adenosylmethionine-8-amino-7-oxononanoate aminotransferase